MLKTTLAYLGEFLRNRFNFEAGSGRVRFTDRDHLISIISSTTNKIELPVVSYSIDSMGMYLGAKDRGRFTGYDNSSDTTVMKYIPLPIRTNVKIGIICRDEIQSFEAITDYFSIASTASFNAVFHNKDDDIEYECGIFELEDLSAPPALKESRSYEERGLLYTLDGGFTIVSNLFYEKHMHEVKLVRATKIDYDLYSGNGTPVNALSEIHESIGVFSEKEEKQFINIDLDRNVLKS